MKKLIYTSNITPQLANEHNYEAFCFLSGKYDYIKKICLPLFQYLKIDTFGYIKIYPDGKYLGFNSEYLWCKNYFQNIQQNRPYITDVIENKPIATKWSESSHNSFNHAVYKAYYDYGLSQGIDICIEKDRIIEAWTFAAKAEKCSLIDLYLKDTHVLKQFIRYFDIKLKAIIGNEIVLAKFRNGATYNNHHNAQLDTNITSFLEHMKKHDREMYIKNSLIRLTMREYQCLCLLTIGHSRAQDIAKILNISPRTIEVYIKNLKYKTGYLLKSDLVKFFLDHLAYYDLNIKEFYRLKNLSKAIESNELKKYV